MHFIDEGEPGIVAIFEELPAENVQRARMFGINFDKPQKDGKLNLIYLRPLDLSVDETVHEIVRSVKEIGATRLVIDSLVGFEMALAPGFREDFRESLYRMIRRRHPIGRDHRKYRRDRGRLRLDGPEQVHRLVSGRRHPAHALRLDQRPVAQDAHGGKDAP
jgi:hypothetical protein